MVAFRCLGINVESARRDAGSKSKSQAGNVGRGTVAVVEKLLTEGPRRVLIDGGYERDDGGIHEASDDQRTPSDGALGRSHRGSARWTRRAEQADSGDRTHSAQ